MDYILRLIRSFASKLKTVSMNPIRNFFMKLQMVFNPNVIANKILKPATKKIKEIFHIAPKSEEDYYSVGRFLIARKLIVALIVGACIAVFAYFNFIAEPVDTVVTTTTGIVTDVYYDYDDMDLADYTGKANIRAPNGSIVYTGDIVNGVCEGAGILYKQSGVLVYEGDFVNNAYEGNGTLYAEDGSVRYRGGFADNTFEGEGVLYASSGQIEYSGGFSGGFYEGTGTLYDQSGNLIYDGGFQNGLYHGSGILYYEDGTKQYEGEFVMGRPQGEGILYRTTGRAYYQGVVSNGHIAYESLIGLSMSDIQEMFLEEPDIYYSQNSTCFVYDSAHVALETDCIVRMVSNKILDSPDTASASNEGDGWYLPEGYESVVTLDESAAASSDTSRDSGTESDLEASDQALVDALNALTEQITSTEEDEDMPTDYVTETRKLYYYVNSSEWVSEADLDMGSILVEGVTVYGADLEAPFSEDTEYVAVNGLVELADCVAIGKIRKSIPTVFSNISYEEVSRGQSYTYVKNINTAQAIYEEVIDKTDFSYQMCYQIDDAENLYYYKISQIQ